MLNICSLFVGAPRAQSTLPEQLDINETGAIYRCSFENSTAPCVPYILENRGNINGGMDEDNHDGEIRANQWLGAAMDGGNSSSDYFVVSVKL